MILPDATAVLVIIAIGALVAADRPLELAPVAGCAIVIGLLNGGLDGVELAKAHFSAHAAVGVVIAPFLPVALLAGNVAAVRAPWVRIAVRIVGVGSPRAACSCWARPSGASEENKNAAHFPWLHRTITDAY